VALASAGGQRLGERAEFGKSQLPGIGHAAKAREFRGQLQVLGEEALDFAIEEETDLPQRVDITFLRQIDHWASI
jgi:hypothetical protein